jgi:hypothetical protein
VVISEFGHNAYHIRVREIHCYYRLINHSGGYSIDNNICREHIVCFAYKGNSYLDKVMGFPQALLMLAQLLVSLWL